MARVQCRVHGPPAGRKVVYSATPYEPAGHPASGLICGLTDCRNPGLVWLSTDEERDYGSGERIFGLQGNLKDAKFRVSVPHRASTTGGDSVLDAGEAETRRAVLDGVRESLSSAVGNLVSNQAEIGRLVALLSDPDRAQNPCTFPKDRDASNSAGLYSWWADSDAQELFARVFAQQGMDVAYRFTKNEMALFYVGQAGATRWPSGNTSNATLMSRIGNLHINGNVAGSTFRKTISAILLESFDLRIAGRDRLDANSESKVSKFLTEHLRVAIVPYGDRNSLGRTEQAVLEELDPPFNIKGCPKTSVRQHLNKLRARFGVG